MWIIAGAASLAALAFLTEWLVDRCDRRTRERDERLQATEKGSHVTRTLYIAGPMTSLPEYNLPAFAAAKAELDRLGYDARNPGSRGVIPGYEWHDYIRDGLRLLLECDGVALLDGWENSSGATVEVQVARALGMDVAPLVEWLTVDASRVS